MSRLVIRIEGDNTSAVQAIRETAAAVGGYVESVDGASQATDALSAEVETSSRAQQGHESALERVAAAIGDSSSAMRLWTETSERSTGSIVDALDRVITRMDDVVDEADDVAGAMADVDQSVGGMRLNVIAANQALDFAKQGFEFLRASAESYFSTTERGQELWTELQRQGDEFKGLLFELVVGTQDQEEAFERLSAVVRDVTTIARGLLFVLQPIAGGLRIVTNVLTSTVIGAFDLFRAVLGQTRQEAELLNAATGDADRNLLTFEERMRAIADATPEGRLADVTRDIEELERVAAEQEAIRYLEAVGVATGRLNEDGTRRFGDQIERLQRLILEGQPGNEALIVAQNEQSGALMNLRVELGLVEGSLGTMTDALERMNYEGADGAVVYDELVRRAASYRTELYGTAEALQVAAVDTEELTAAYENLAAATEKALSQMRVLTAEERQRELGRKAKDQERRETAGLEKLAALEAAAAAEAEANAFEVANKRKVVSLEEYRAAMAAADRHEAELAARREYRHQVAEGLTTSFASAFGQMATSMVTSQQTAGEAIKGFLGDMLVALGTAGMAQAAMMLFQPQFMGLAVGLAIASGAAIAAGRALGASASSAATAPAAPPTQASVTNNYSNTLVSNVGRVGSMEAYLQSLDEDLQQLQQRGSRAA